MSASGTERLAGRVRGKRSLPVDVEGILSDLGVSIRERDLPPTLDGMTLSDSDVILRSTLGGRRRRFVLAHELGHVLVRRGQAAWVDASSEERFADEFALALLVGPVEPDLDLRGIAKRAKVEERVAAWALSRAGMVPSLVTLTDGTEVEAAPATVSDPRCPPLANYCSRSTLRWTSRLSTVASSEDASEKGS